MANVAARYWTAHELSIEDIVCKHPGPQPPVSAYDSIITVKVVESDTVVSKNFPIYRGLLCFHSQYFSRALNEPFKEGDPVTYNVFDCSIRTFTLFFNWMNTGIVSLGTDEDDSPTEIDAVHLYTFADCYGIPMLKIGALEYYLMAALEDRAFDFDAVHAMYESTPETSPLKKLVLDVLMDTWKFNMNTLKQACAQSPQLGTDILERCWSKEVVPGMNEWNGFSGPLDWERDMIQHFCERYHDHTEAGVDSKKKA